MRLQHVASVSLHMTPVNLSTVSLAHTHSLSLSRPSAGRPSTVALRTSKLRENRPPSKTDVIRVDAANWQQGAESSILNLIRKVVTSSKWLQRLERWETISLRSNACMSNGTMQQCPQTCATRTPSGCMHKLTAWVLSLWFKKALNFLNKSSAVILILTVSKHE